MFQKCFLNMLKCFKNYYKLITNINLRELIYIYLPARRLGVVAIHIITIMLEVLRGLKSGWVIRPNAGWQRITDHIPVRVIKERNLMTLFSRRQHPMWGRDESAVGPDVHEFTTVDQHAVFYIRGRNPIAVRGHDFQCGDA